MPICSYLERFCVFGALIGMRCKDIRVHPSHHRPHHALVLGLHNGQIGCCWATAVHRRKTRRECVLKLHTLHRTSFEFKCRARESAGTKLAHGVDQQGPRQQSHPVRLTPAVEMSMLVLRELEIRSASGCAGLQLWYSASVVLKRALRTTHWHT